MQNIIEHFKNGFESALQKRTGERRIGAELKFPLVNSSGEAVTDYAVLGLLWKFLEKNGWRQLADQVSGESVGACCDGPLNETIAGCETGFCKTEFSLAHVGDLHQLKIMVDDLIKTLRRFQQEYGYYFIGCGIHPVTRPGKHLSMSKSRNIFWDRIFDSNRYIPPEDGDDVHLFTVNASSQTHIDVDINEAVDAINVFNGFSGAQIALTANSSVWKNDVDPEYKCAGEMFWDMWIPGTDRYGVPSRPFNDLDDYIKTIVSLPPVYVRRDGIPYGLPDYDSFYEFYRSNGKAKGITADGETIELTPQPADIDQHSTFYWYNARISRYYTLENRVNDQQPPDDLITISALTLGLTCNLNEAIEVIREYDWQTLRQSRLEACKDGITAKVGDLEIATISRAMLDVAQKGLKSRGLGEEIFLAPLFRRLQQNLIPADEMERIFREGGAQALVEKRKL